MAESNSTRNVRAKSAAVNRTYEVRFGIPSGRVAKVPYVDEGRDYVDLLVMSAIQTAIEAADTSACDPDPDAVHRAADILRLARERIEAERARIRHTSYIGEERRP